MTMLYRQAAAAALFSSRIRLRAGAALVLAAGLSIAAVGCSSQNGSPSTVQTNHPPGEGILSNAGDEEFANVKDPSFTAETYYAAGQFAESQRATPKAITQYQAALKLNPKHAPSLYRLAIIYTHGKMNAQAIDAWKKYVEATNRSAPAYANLAMAYESMNQPAEADAAFKAGIAQDSMDQSCRVNYGLTLARRGQPGEAMEQLLVVLPPAEAHYNLGSVFEEQGKLELARLAYRNALKADPNMTDAKERLKTVGIADVRNTGGL